MNKSEFVALIAEKTGLLKKDTEKTINAVFEAIGDGLARGERFQISGFGTFETRERAARPGNNPRSSERMMIPAATVPVFKPSKNLKDKVDSKRNAT